MEQVKLGMGPSSEEILEALATSPKRQMGQPLSAQEEEELKKLRSSLSWLENIDEAEFELESEREPVQVQVPLTIQKEPQHPLPPTKAKSTGWIGAGVHHHESQPRINKVIKEGWLTKEGNNTIELYFAIHC